MSEKPILFSGPMVCAILDGRKTMTRRVIKSQPATRLYQMGEGSSWWAECDPWDRNEPINIIRCPYRVGDLLWVRETWATVQATGETVYRADGVFSDGAPWRPSIFMPRWASRITLEVTAVRAERLQDITEQDAMAEGIAQKGHYYGLPGDKESDYSTARAAFYYLWDLLTPKHGYSCEKNPAVWVYAFGRVES